MTERNDLLDHAVGLFPVPDGSVADVHRDLARRQRNRKLAAGAVVVAIWLVIGVAAVALRSHGDTVPAQTPSPTVDLGADDRLVNRWPTTTRNSAGVYSWDGPGNLTEADSRVEGVMHNGYKPGSGHAYIFIQGDAGQLIPHRGETPVTVFGYQGTYRRFTGKTSGQRGPVEEWMVDIQGTTVTVSLVDEEPGARDSELAEAHEMIESIRVEPQDNALGFRLLFTLTTNTWDSG